MGTHRIFFRLAKAPNSLENVFIGSKNREPQKYEKNRSRQTFVLRVIVISITAVNLFELSPNKQFTSKNFLQRQTVTKAGVPCYKTWDPNLKPGANPTTSEFTTTAPTL
jgi:hypothetical protein